MRDGICPKCRATTVYAAMNGIGQGHDSSHRAQLRPHLAPDFRGAVVLHQADLWDFVCTSCGFLETYVLDRATLVWVRERWAPVPVTAEPTPDAGSTT